MFHNVHHARAQSITINHNGIRFLLVNLFYYFVRELYQVQAAILAQNAVLSALSDADNAAVIAKAGHANGQDFRHSGKAFRLVLAESINRIRRDERRKAHPSALRL